MSLTESSQIVLQEQSVIRRPSSHVSNCRGMKICRHKIKTCQMRDIPCFFRNIESPMFLQTMELGFPLSCDICAQLCLQFLHAIRAVIGAMLRCRQCPVQALRFPCFSLLRVPPTSINCAKSGSILRCGELGKRTHSLFFYPILARGRKGACSIMSNCGYRIELPVPYRFGRRRR
jgi:hypothetical protein